MNSAKRLLWIGFFLTLLVSAFAADPEIPTPVTLQEVPIRNGTALYCQNSMGNDVTVTLHFTHRVNFVATPPWPYSVTVPGHTKALLSQLRPADPRQKGGFGYEYFWTFGSMAAHHDDSVVYSLPYSSGQTFRIIQGYHGAFSHHGDNEYALDFSLPEGSPVRACREGKVVFTEGRFHQGGAEKKYRDRANCVRVRHADKTIGEYDHLRQNGIVVKEGERVKPGQLLGYSGNTGFSAGPHLHFCVYRARDGHSRQSFPVHFRVRNNPRPQELVQDGKYTAP